MTKPSRRPQLSSAVAAAQWIDDRTDRSARTWVGGMLPWGFEAYACVLHPAYIDDKRLRWADVAERIGTPLTAETWFQDLADSADELRYGFEAPALGEIPDEVLDLLMPVLAEHTTSSKGWFCLWEGWGFVHGSMGRMTFWPSGSPPTGRASHFKARPAFDAAALRMCRLPWRPDYVLFEGPLEAIGELGGEVTWDPVDGDGIQDQPTTSFERQTPSLFWPEDRAWCAANDIEASFTLIGGTARLIDALYDNAGLEAAPVD